MDRIYDYDLPLRECDLSPHNPEAHEAVKEYHRKVKLYKMAAGLVDFRPGGFAALAAAGDGPDVHLKGKPHLLAYAIICFAVECVDDLLGLGVDPRQPCIAEALMGADEYAKAYYQQLINNRR